MPILLKRHEQCCEPLQYAKNSAIHWNTKRDKLASEESGMKLDQPAVQESNMKFTPDVMIEKLKSKNACGSFGLEVVQGAGER